MKKLDEKKKQELKKIPQTYEIKIEKATEIDKFQLKYCIDAGQKANLEKNIKTQT